MYVNLPHDLLLAVLVILLAEFILDDARAIILNLALLVVLGQFDFVGGLGDDLDRTDCNFDVFLPVRRTRRGGQRPSGYGALGFR